MFWGLWKRTCPQSLAGPKTEILVETVQDHIHAGIVLGGPDPLDYVSMYRNVGSPSANIPEHWHYISFGLSDLYGDNRVHEFTGTDGPSGFGFELTFRLKRETGESAPPTWPAELMQGLARYVFQSENTFCSGDHVSWHSPLDNSESRIQHMLLTEDPQMQPVQTPFGVVTFLQIVGVCTEELHSAQQWNGQGILELLRTVPIAGGPWLITDMRRGETIFEIDPHLQQERVDKGIETDGSNLSGVSAKCAWDDLSRPPEDDEDSRSICIGTQPRRLSGKDTEQIRETLRRGLEINSKPVLPPINPQRQNGLAHDRAPSRKDSLESDSSTAIIPHELIRTRQLESVHLKFNQESGALIPLCLRGRLLHGRHFTYKSITGDMAITFVSTGVEGAFATEEHPYAAHGPWLQRPPSCELPSRPVCSPSCVHSFLVISQRGNFCSWQLTIPRGNLILLTEEFVEKMLEDLEDLTSPEEFKLPKEYSWPEKKLKVSILPDVVFDSPLH
ncbi:suppressor of fused homolog isoform X3 [Homo sapiens]|uniref:suppressor of fused homolog isoform X3 n=1 Tax=Homo sapiens TaxID=9606 RepID=UPI0005D02F75|nr:suppressor of fused homolog isoform X3 [Homo sapiens]XP_054222041.1 suppressor of fused homolog isoform X3 [Homo sapiens]|eukprot:XP_016871812.1 suppressor of fused homolog isoform X3 [Homo sapiens]